MFVDLDEYVQISSRFGYSARTMLAQFPDHWAALRSRRIRYLVSPEVERPGLTIVEKYVKHSRKLEHGDKTFMRPEKVVANGVHYVDVLEESGRIQKKYRRGCSFEECVLCACQAEMTK
jgi:hypothetical protein